MTPGAQPTLFLLSPANLSGARAKQLRSRKSSFPAAIAYRDGGVAIAEAFSFMSALYFRGKIAYAHRFASLPEGCPGRGVLIITAGYGLVPPEWRLDRDRMRRLQRIRIDHSSRAYRKPLERDLAALREACDSDTRFVLLGSLATGKYLDVLHPILGDRLSVPAAFVGMGDMQRGSKLLKAVESGTELEYVSVDHLAQRSISASTSS